MSAVSSSTSTTAASQTTGNSVQDLDLDAFLQLMLTELVNQDPLNPMDNKEMLNTIGQIREISANDKLSETLESVLLGQNVTTATSMIGAEVEGLTDGGQRVVGAVRQVLITDGEAELELAVETSASAGIDEGGVAAGEYTYEVVWETEDGAFSLQIPVDTEEFDDEFLGSIRLENLPETKVAKTVYRSNGGGELKYVGKLLSGSTTGFTDTLADSELGEETLTGQRSVLRYADAVRVRLSNVGSVQTLD